MIDKNPLKCCHRGNNQCSVSSWICHIGVDQSSLDELWHSLEFTEGCTQDQLLWQDFQRSFRTKLISVQGQNRPYIPAQALSHKSVERFHKHLSTPTKGSSVCFQQVLIFIWPVLVYVYLHTGLQSPAGGWVSLASIVPGLPRLTRRDLI